MEITNAHATDCPALAPTALWQRAAEAMDALHDLQCTPMWPLLPLPTRRAICAARFHCEAVIDAIDATDTEN